ncbi:hypothetical protein FRC10_010574 [Ceratobasidium sp. 414]|nr:hypothetical protein FRC10_010574 [Ceratobasidium sp. 414]
MFIALLPLLMLATSLQQSALNCLNYYNAANLSHWTSRLFAAGSMSQGLLGTVIFVDSQVEGRVEPLFPSSLRFKNVDSASYFNSAPAVALGSGEPVVYGSDSSPSIEPTRPSSAVAPIRGFADGLAASVTSLRFPLPLPTSSAPLVGGHALDVSPLPVEPIVLDSAVSESVPTPYPTLSATAAPDSRPPWASQHVWMLVWTLPLAVYLGIGIGLYLAPPKEADLPKIFRLLAELGDLPYIINDYGISPTELRNYIELVVRTRQSVYGERTAEAEVTSPQGKFISLESIVSRAPSAGSCPVPGPSSARQEGHVSASARTNSTPDTTNPPAGLAAMAGDSSAILAQIDRRCAELRAKEAMFERRMEELSEAIDSAPRWNGETLVCAAPVAGTSVERRKTEMRARANVSPLAHRASKRSSGLSLGGMLPTPGPSRTRTQPAEPRTGGNAANDPEDVESTGFNPAATSTPVRARQASSLATDRAQRMAPRTTRRAGPTSPDIFLSQAGPSQLREPFPPRSPAYVSFGTLAELHPPRPQAPEPDTTLESSSSA